MRRPVTIRLACAGGVEHRVDAQPVGPFFVHRTPDMIHQKWTLTHGASGYAVLRTDTKNACMHAARVLQQLPGVDWSFTDPLTVKGWSPTRIRRIYKIKHAAGERPAAVPEARA